MNFFHLVTILLKKEFADAELFIDRFYERSDLACSILERLPEMLPFLMIYNKLYLFNVFIP
jgi:hypothetical protein